MTTFWPFNCKNELTSVYSHVLTGLFARRGRRLIKPTWPVLPFRVSYRLGNKKMKKKGAKHRFFDDMGPFHKNPPSPTNNLPI